MLRPIFMEAGYGLPPLRVSMGWTLRGRGRYLAECWPRDCSAIGVNEIFVTPAEDDSVVILDHLTHEIVHAIDDCRNGHGPPFRRIAQAIGMEGPMTYARAGTKLRKRLRDIAAQLGPIPHQKILMP